MKKVLLALLSSALIVGGAQAKSKPKTHPSKAKKEALVCPVTGDKIASKADAAGHSTYKGKTYYFCCGGCKPQFDKNPEKFLSKAKTDKSGDKKG
jgi:Cu+-exporting ATPase